MVICCECYEYCDKFPLVISFIHFVVLDTLGMRTLECSLGDLMRNLGL